MQTEKRISFHVTREEVILISKIIRRAHEMNHRDGSTFDNLTAHMDISACIAQGVPLKLQEWLDAPDFDFAHDFYGIMRHINRRTGELEDCFVPRFADLRKREQGSALTPVIAILTALTVALVLIGQSGLLHTICARLAEVR